MTKGPPPPHRLDVEADYANGDPTGACTLASCLTEALEDVTVEGFEADALKLPSATQDSRFRKPHKEATERTAPMATIRCSLGW